MGLLTAFIGMAFGLRIIAKTLLLGEPVQGYPSLISVITFLGGVQLISVGVLGEYVGKTYFEAKRSPVYLIRDIIHSGQPAAAPMRPAKTAMPAEKAQRAEDRRGGKAGVSTCGTRWTPYHYKKHKTQN